MFTLLMSCWLGFLIGLRHALDPDHLAAMSALVVEQPRRFRAAVQGAFWGAGHAAALLVTGALLLAWRIQLPERWAELFELAASAMLIGLGVRSVRSSLRARGAAITHRHGPASHAHAGDPGHFHVRSWTVARRPFLVGIAHGLAGTGAITALALASMPSARAAAAYLLVFALGSTGGMALLTGLLGVPIGRIARRPAAHAVLMAGIGAVSLLVGIVWGAPILGRLLSS